MIRIHSLLAATSLLALSSTALGQSFNVDVGDEFGTPGISAGVPPNTYGAAAAQPGFWNAASFLNFWVVTGGIKDLTGAATAITTSCVQMGNSVGNFYFDSPSTVGDDAMLLDDCQDIGNGGTLPASEAVWTFSGLANGCYEVYVYAWAPDNAGFVSFVEDPNLPGMGAVVGGAYSGALVEGAQYARFTVQITNNTAIIRVTSNGVAANFGSVNGFQFKIGVPGCTTGTSFCSGDGSGTACPCGNSGAPGNGCASSVNANGATLTAMGTTSVAADAVVLTGAGMPNSSCLYFQGTTQQNGGMGTAFGDGLRCAGGVIMRLGTKANAGGTSQYPSGGDLSITQKGMVPPGGGTRTYQCWYRNAAAFCTASTFNLSNGLEIVWTP